MKRKLTQEEKMAIFEELLKSHDPNEVIVKSDDYINPVAAKLIYMFKQKYPNDFSGEVYTKKGVPLSKAFQDFYGVPIEKAASDYTGGENEFAGVTDFRGTGYMAEQTAEKFWNFVVQNADPILREIDVVLSKKNPMPVNMQGIIEENLISSVRAGEQPGTNLKKQVARFRKNLLARHIEMQFDLQYEDIVNNLDEPNFVQNVINPVMKSFANDVVRLWFNGTSYDYSSVNLGTNYPRSNMYKLLQGFIYKLMNENGSYTADQVNMVLGYFGKEITANKYAIDEVGDTVSKWSPTFDTTEGFVNGGGGDATVSVSSNHLRVTKGTTGTVCYAVKTGIAVVPNKQSILNVTAVGNDSTSTWQIKVKAHDGTLLGESAIDSGTTAVTYAIPFYTLNANYVQVEFHQTTNEVYADFYDVSLTQNIEEHTGQDIIDIMDELIKLRPHKYSNVSGYKFMLSPEDAFKYADAKSSPVTLVQTGNYVGVNNTTREMYMVKGVVPMHKGFEVVVNPFMHSIDKQVNYGGVNVWGSIIFYPPKGFVAFGLKGNFPFMPLSSTEFKARGKHGGAEIEYTKHAWTDAVIRMNGMFSIASVGLKVEAPVLMQSDDPKAEPVTSTTTAADGCYVYCDTRDARIFATKTSNVADIATLELAIQGVTAGDVKELTEGEVFNTVNGLTAESWSFRAFKDGTLIKSDITAHTFV